MANPEHLAILEQGVDVWNEWRRENNYIRPDLSGVDLEDVDFSVADLSRTDLRGANLFATNFFATDLRKANLSAAVLRAANVHGANLFGANLRGVYLWETVFVNVDMSEVNGLETVNHDGPSFIDISTIYRSNGKIPEIFLRGAGVPESFITYMTSLTGQAFDFYSCFISYSAKDEEFARRLHADLQAKGVRCWFAREDMKIGSPILSEIDSAIRLHDKLLLILSSDSVQSRWVEHEVLSATTKEYGEERKHRVLFPVRIDDAVMDTDVPWAQTMRGTRHIGDFTRWKDHDAYQQAFDRLLRDLKQS